jgi:type II secretory pathway component PulF
MPQFQYKAKTRTGETVTGTLAAADRRVALTQLDRMGMFPIDVVAAQEAAPKLAAPREFFTQRRVRPRHVLQMTQQLSNLLRSGMSLSQALGTLARRTEKNNPLSAILADIRNDIVQGSNLSDALAKYPRIFSKLYVNIVRAGEASGALDQVLVRLAQHYERAQEVRDKIMGALLYPAIIFVVGIGTVIFFMTVMVPRFSQMFAEMGRTLPLPTQILIGVSRGFVRFWWLGALLILAGVVLYKAKTRSAAGRLMVDRLKLKIPIYGKTILLGSLAQFARTLATLLENGVPVLNALQITEDTMTNQVIANEIRQARTRVTDGTTISEPLAKGKIFPPMFIDMLAVGEESGEMTEGLKNIADTYEQELARDLKVFTSLLEPAIIIAMALVVGGIVISVLLAVFDITSGIGR